MDVQNTYKINDIAKSSESIMMRLRKYLRVSRFSRHGFLDQDQEATIGKTVIMIYLFHLMIMSDFLSMRQ